MEILSAYRLGLAKFQAIFWTEKKKYSHEWNLFYKFMEVWWKLIGKGFMEGAWIGTKLYNWPKE